VLQCLSDVAYVAAAVIPLAAIGLVRLARRDARGRRPHARDRAGDAGRLGPVYAGYAVVAARNPDIAEQTNWRGAGSTLFPWLGQHLTALPWGPFRELAPMTVAPVALVLAMLGVVACVGGGSDASRRLARHAVVWTVVGLVVSLTPAIEWNGSVLRLPHAWPADWNPIRVLREPERLAIAALIGTSLLAGLAFARATARWRLPLRMATALVILAAIHWRYANGVGAPPRPPPRRRRAIRSHAADTSPEAGARAPRRGGAGARGAGRPDGRRDAVLQCRRALSLDLSLATARERLRRLLAGGLPRADGARRTPAGCGRARGAPA
jgi:hypothetical protein